jgi:hypothetical protein
MHLPAQTHPADDSDRLPSSRSGRRKELIASTPSRKEPCHVEPAAPRGGAHVGRAWPSGQTEPNSTLLNYGTRASGTGATLPIN